MKLEIVSPDGILFEGEAENVSLPGVGGGFDVSSPITPLNSGVGRGNNQVSGQRDKTGTNDTKRIRRSERRRIIHLCRIKIIDNEWQVKNEADGMDHIHQRDRRYRARRFVVHDLAGTLFHVVSIHPYFLLDNVYDYDIYPRPGKEKTAT